MQGQGFWSFLGTIWAVWSHSVTVFSHKVILAACLGMFMPLNKGFLWFQWTKLGQTKDHTYRCP